MKFGSNYFKSFTKKPEKPKLNLKAEFAKDKNNLPNKIETKLSFMKSLTPQKNEQPEIPNLIENVEDAIERESILKNKNVIMKEKEYSVTERVIRNDEDKNHKLNIKEIISERASPLLFDEKKMEIHGELALITQSSQSRKVCVICYTDEPDAVIMNCGHGGICYQCALVLWNKSLVCSFCREVILI